MGWSSGPELAESIWASIRGLIPGRENKIQAAKTIYQEFNQYDADDWSCGLLEDIADPSYLEQYKDTDPEHYQKRLDHIERELADTEFEQADVPTLTGMPEPTIKEMHLKDGQMEIDFRVSQEMIAVFGYHFGALMEAYDAKNFIEMELTHPDPKIGALIFTLRKKFGKMPSTMREEAIARLKRAEDFIKALHGPHLGTYQLHCKANPLPGDPDPEE